MIFRRHYLICFVLYCLPVLASAQARYYFVESGCDGCRPTAHDRTGRYLAIADQVRPFTMGGSERERELIEAEFKAGLATAYANYPVMARNVTIHAAQDHKTAEQARKEYMTAMREKGYRVEERPSWLSSHRAIPEVDDYMQFASRLGFDGVVLIAENDWVVHRRGYGRARAEGDLPNCPPVAFPVGALTKAFTAQAILLMQEAGRLRLSDNLGKIFRGIPTDKRTITIQQLLTHTSGLERDVVLEDGESGAEVLDAIMDSKLQAMPGERYQYSNAGYQLLALIVQKVTREPYDQFLREQILVPFQLTHTGFEHQLPDNAPVADGGMAVRPQPFLSRPEESPAYLGSGGVVMTADDLHRWFRSISKLPIFFEMTRPRLDIERSHGFSAHYKLVIAEGESEGYHAHLNYDPARHRLIILLSNDGLPASAGIAGTLTRNIGRIMDKQKVKTALEHTVDMTGYPGVYIQGQDTLRVETEGGRLKVHFTGGRLADAIINQPGAQPAADTTLLRFALPTAERTLTCFDLATEQTQELLFSEDRQVVWVGDLKLERRGQP